MFAAACHNGGMSANRPGTALSKPLAATMVVIGLGGLLGAFELATEYVKTLQNPAYTPNCSLNILVTCGPNMQSWQGSLFGFPNALLGLMCFIFPIAVGMSTLAGARMARWYWQLFNIGMLGGYVFITWLYSQSIFVLGTLCPWCMEVWFFMIFGFWYITAWNLREGHFGSGLKRFGVWLFHWAWVVSLLNLVLIAVLAEIRLGWIEFLL